jgi:DNA-binding protein H-NS
LISAQYLLKDFAMASLQELLSQKEALERQIELTQKQERSAAIAKVKALMTEYGLTSADIAGTTKANSGKSSKKVAAKYRNSATGEAWSGRGLQPNWLKAALASGRKLQEFAV